MVLEAFPLVEMPEMRERSSWSRAESLEFSSASVTPLMMVVLWMRFEVEFGGVETGGLKIAGGVGVFGAVGVVLIISTVVGFEKRFLKKLRREEKKEGEELPSAA